MPGLEDHRPPLEALDQDPDLVVGGEVHRAEDALAALAPRAHSAAASSSAAATSGSSIVSKKPNIASLPPWYSSQRLVDLGADAADRLAVALGEEVLGLAVLEPGVLLAVEELHPLEDQRRHPLRVSRWRRNGTLTKRFSSRRVRTGRIVTLPIGAATYTLGR